jgi:FkbM family methyltransferase
MLIYNEKGEPVDTSKLETYEQFLATKYVRADDTVLELGARYGSVSVCINNKLNNRKAHIAIEPDSRVWEALTFNRTINKCEFEIVKGFVSTSKLDLVNLDCYFGGYGATAVRADNTKIPSYTLQEIKIKFGIPRFTCLVADCEGFLEQFFDENPELYAELETVIFEADYAEKCDYKNIENNLLKCGFNPIEQGFQNVWKK